MNQVIERKLLYYDHFKRMPRHYNGEPIFHFIFKDVKTGEDTILGACYFNQEVSEILGGYYYNEITEAENDFDILWNVSNERISPIDDAFEDVQAEYQRMLNEGVSQEEINSAIMTLFQNKSKSRC